MVKINLRKIGKMNKMNIWFYGKVSWFDRPLARPTKKRRCRLLKSGTKEGTLLSTSQKKKGP